MNIFSKKNKKSGVSIETAIGFTVLIFALCTLIMIVSFSTRLRDDSMAKRTNTYFSVDQIGEYFVQSLRGGTTIRSGEGEDIAVPEYKNDWLKYGDYGIRMDEDTTTKMHTLRVIDWDDAGKSNPNLRLVVSVVEQTSGRNTVYTVTNWSDTEVVAATEEVKPDVKKDNTHYRRNSMEEFWRWLTRYWIRNVFRHFGH